MARPHGRARASNDAGLAHALAASEQDALADALATTQDDAALAIALNASSLDAPGHAARGTRDDSGLARALAVEEDEALAEHLAGQEDGALAQHLNEECVQPVQPGSLVELGERHHDPGGRLGLALAFCRMVTNCPACCPPPHPPDARADAQPRAGLASCDPSARALGRVVAPTRAGTGGSWRGRGARSGPGSPASWAASSSSPARATSSKAWRCCGIALTRAGGRWWTSRATGRASSARWRTS